MPRSVVKNVGFCGGFLYGIGLFPVEQRAVAITNPQHVARFRDRYEHDTHRANFLTLTHASVYMNRLLCREYKVRMCGSQTNFSAKVNSLLVGGDSPDKAVRNSRFRDVKGRP